MRSHFSTGPGRLLPVTALAVAAGFACRRAEDAPRHGAPHGPAATQPWFSDVTDAVGLDFVHDTGARGLLMFPEIMAVGAATLDYDNDGRMDILLLRGHGGLPERTEGGETTTRLYRQDEAGRFHDVTRASGLSNKGYAFGALVGDIDNDGRVDVFVSNYGPDRLFRNLGDGRFVDHTDAAGIQVPGWSVSAAMLDFDRDGFLDIYVSEYVEYDPATRCTDSAGRRDYCGPDMFPPARDVLLHNRGDGTFADVSDAAGITSVAAPGLGVICMDFDEDGWTDIYVANDRRANFLWINQTDGTFREEAMLYGAAYNIDGVAEGSMGVVATDVDRDRDLDLFLTHFEQETNTLYAYHGRGLGFVDESAERGLALPSIGYTGFGIVALDIELDGDVDLFVANGRVTRTQPSPHCTMPLPWSRYAEPNQFFLNDGTGHFHLAEAAVAALCDPVEISRAAVGVDYDNDGDVDILISNVQGPARLYRNDAPRQGHWLTVRAVDPRYHRDAVGARIAVDCGPDRWVRAVQAGGSYLSSDDPRYHFGIGPCTEVDAVEVSWPDGLRERFTGLAADQHIEVVRGQGRAVP
jgi:hypothetical protein